MPVSNVGVTCTAAVAVPLPALLLAAIEHEYATPPISPMTLIGEDAPVAVTVTWPAAVQVTV